MGSRAVVIVCRDENAARDRFGAADGETGAIYTRTARPFLDTRTDTEEALGRLRAAIDAAELWDTLDTAWLALDCELLPWSAKAMDLIHRQYASVGAAPHAGLTATITTLEAAAARSLDVTGLVDAQRARRPLHRRYVTPVNGVHDLRLAPCPHPRRRNRRLHRPRSHLASPTLRPARRRRPQPVQIHRSTDGRRHRQRQPSHGDRLVGAAHRLRGRRHGRQTDHLYRPWPQRTRAARQQTPRPRIPAHHLRPRIRRTRTDRPAPLPQRTENEGSPSASSGSASKDPRGSSPTGRFTKSTSACSESSHSRENRATHDLDIGSSPPPRFRHQPPERSFPEIGLEQRATR
jgi:hypothetical protein